jgi:hypothetical protein
MERFARLEVGLRRAELSAWLSSGRELNEEEAATLRVSGVPSLVGHE